MQHLVGNQKTFFYFIKLNCVGTFLNVGSSSSQKQTDIHIKIPMSGKQEEEEEPCEHIRMVQSVHTSNSRLTPHLEEPWSYLPLTVELVV